MNQREAQAAESRQKLIESAQALFAEKGFAGTSVREINHRAGLASGLMYHYFPGGKKDLFRVVIEKNLAEIIADFSDSQTVATYTEMPLMDMLEAVYGNFTEIIHRHMDIIRILFRENEVREMVDQDALSNMIHRNTPWFKNLLMDKHERGEIREMDFTSAAISMEALLLNHVMAMALGQKKHLLSAREDRQALFAYFTDMWKEAAK